MRASQAQMHICPALIFFVIYLVCYSCWEKKKKRASIRFENMTYTR